MAGGSDPRLDILLHEGFFPGVVTGWRVEVFEDILDRPARKFGRVAYLLILLVGGGDLLFDIFVTSPETEELYVHG